jgi:hypothetical protein
MQRLGYDLDDREFVNKGHNILLNSVLYLTYRIKCNKIRLVEENISGRILNFSVTFYGKLEYFANQKSNIMKYKHV